MKKEKIEGEIVALVSPHAGYMYSGQVAAYAYKLIEGKNFDSVVVIAPSHRVLFKGASIYDRGGYQTPLGVVPVDVELSKKMMEKRKEIQFLPEAHSQEHSLEVQVPSPSDRSEILQTHPHRDGALLELGDLSISCLCDCRHRKRKECPFDRQYRPIAFSLL